MPGRERRFQSGAVRLHDVLVPAIDDDAILVRFHVQGVAWLVHDADLPTIAAAGFLPAGVGAAVPPSTDGDATHVHFHGWIYVEPADAVDLPAPASVSDPDSAVHDVPANVAPAADPLTVEHGMLPDDVAEGLPAKRLLQYKLRRRTAAGRSTWNRQFFLVRCFSHIIPPIVCFSIAGFVGLAG